MLVVSRRLGDLDAGLILSPERYVHSEDLMDGGVPLGDLVSVEKATLSPKRSEGVGVLVADTGNAELGVLKLGVAPVQKINSNKKVLQEGDVLISRLRPYLKQVAYSDPCLFQGDHMVVASTEFYVLRSRSGQSIAFLVPWLLSEAVQTVLQHSVEGAHHPRFSELTLLRLRVPEGFLAERDHISNLVAEYSSMFHRQCKGMNELIDGFSERFD